LGKCEPRPPAGIQVRIHGATGFCGRYCRGVTKRLQVMGGGKMGEALIGGLVSSRWSTADQLHVIEPSADRRAELEARLPGLVTGDALLAGVDALIAVKPDIVPVVLPLLAGAAVPRVLSIAAGVRIATLEAALPAGTAVVRCMPNTPAVVGAGAAAVAAGTAATADDIKWATGILSSVGVVVEVDERDLDAVTGLSGSGPAYVFHLAEAMIAAGVEQGLTPEIADTLTRQTLLGAARLLSESGEDPAVLRVDVTSPGGTTAAGLAVFAGVDFPAIVSRVVEAATGRSRELGAG